MNSLQPSGCPAAAIARTSITKWVEGDGIVHVRKPMFHTVAMRLCRNNIYLTRPRKLHPISPVCNQYTKYSTLPQVMKKKTEPY